MKKLEHKTYDSKREMQLLDALQEVKQINKRKQMLTPDHLLKELIEENEPKKIDDNPAELEMTQKQKDILEKLKNKKKQKIEESVLGDDESLLLEIVDPKAFLEPSDKIESTTKEKKIESPEEDLKKVEEKSDL